MSYATPTSAQEPQGVTANDGPAITESAQDTVAALGIDEAVQTAAVKEVSQDTAKSVPSEADELQSIQDKLSLFMPALAATGNAADESVQAALTQYTIKYETFEGAFPNGLWRTYDCDGRTNGEYFWDDDDYKPYSGRWSAWPANGGYNQRDPQYYYYPNRACTWMIYGPFSLATARYAYLNFAYWNQSERNYDYFAWYASTNGTNFYGTRVSGDSGGWKGRTLDLSAVPTLGNTLGDSSVWIAFRFTSDGSVVDDGPFVDNVWVYGYR
jgi:hypothetical protein